jgi:hypothetical protein
MGLLTFRCPSTGQAVDAGIEADTDTLSQIRLFKLRLVCPKCGGAHDYSIQEAYVVDAPAGVEAYGRLN